MKLLQQSKHKLTRRSTLAGMGASAFVLSSLGPLRAQQNQLVMATGGGKLEDAYRNVVYNPFKEISGYDVVTTSNEGARLKSMVEQGNVEWDLIQTAAEVVVVYGREGLLEPIDYSIIDKSKMIEGAAHEYFVLTDLAAYHVAWNTRNVTGEGPKNWAELFDLDGRIGLWKRPFQTLEAALLADGVPLTELYPLDVDRAFASLDKIKSKLVWWDKGAQGAQLLLDGEVDAGAIWNGRVHQPKIDGAPVDFTFDQAILVSDGWAVPKGAPNKQKAMEMMAYALSAKAQAAFAENIPYGPVNTEAMDLIPDSVQSGLPTMGDGSVLLDVNYWAENSADVVERFNTWLLS